MSRRTVILARLHFWSRNVALAHEHSIFTDGWNRIRFAVAVGQFQSAQAIARRDHIIDKV